MNEQKREQISAQISALTDGELTQEASPVIDSLLQDNEAKQTWTRYHLIGDSLRGHLPEQIGDISANVSQAIASEPTVLAPVKKKSSDLMKPVMGFAIAASVAAVAIFNVQQANQISETGQSPGTGQTVIAQSSIATSQPSLATSPQLVTQGKGQAQVYQVRNIDPRLNRYLVNHNEYRANTGVSGMPPHVRMVANAPESNE